MTKIEWFIKVAVYRGKDAPFGQPFVKGSSLYATDGHCILRTQVDDLAISEEFSAEGMDITGFWKNMKAAYKGIVPKGQIDALLLQEMAEPPLWEKANKDNTKILLVDGTLFYSAAIANAMAGWTEPSAMFSRIISEDMTIGDRRKKKVIPNRTETSPIVLTGEEVQVIILPFFSEGEKADLEFPESALVEG